MDNPLNVATPFTAATLVPPLNVPALGLLPMVSVTVAELLTTLPPASSILTTGCCANGVLEAELALGCVVNTTLVAGPGLKATVTVWAVLSSVKEQFELPVPQPELIVYPEGIVQAPIVDGVVGVAVSVTVAVFPNETEQAVPDAAPPVSVQENPEPVIEPLPVPAKARVTTLLSVNVFWAWRPDTLPTAVK